MEDLWNQFQAALRNYQETTEERKKSFEELKAKDEKSAKEIEMQMRKLQRLSVRICHCYSDHTLLDLKHDVNTVQISVDERTGTQSCCSCRHNFYLAFFLSPYFPAFCHFVKCRCKLNISVPESPFYCNMAIVCILPVLAVLYTSVHYCFKFLCRCFSF